ncbi:MAG: hypothetical protein NVV68_00400 [Dokdonella sp.]|nr:hypothetical protein [Dokdonella sp.]
MATQDDTELVLAHGEHGLEWAPRSEVVEVQTLPLGPSNEIVPATLRSMNQYKGGGAPTRLLRVEKPTKRNGRRFALIRFECTPFVRYDLGDGPVYGTEHSCYVRHERDAADPLFDSLSSRERARIVRASRVETRA